jgi:hypothetical protein
MISPRRVAVAALLVALAALPNVVVLAAACYQSLPAAEIAWVHVHLPGSLRPSFVIDVPSLEWAKAIVAGWDTYRHLGVVFALVAAYLVAADFLPIPRGFGSMMESDNPRAVQGRSDAPDAK